MLHAAKVGVGAGPIRAAADARRAVARSARPAGEFDASRYFRGSPRLGFYNVGAARVRALAREIVAQHPEWSVEDALVFADALIGDRYLEVKGLGIEVLARFRRHVRPAFLRVWKRWLSSNFSDNWATTDGMCGLLIGPLLVSHPALVSRMRTWARDRNMWVRRAAIVALIPSLRQGRALDEMYEIARTLHRDREDLIQKAVGWALREAGKVDPDRLERYLRSHGTDVPRTTVRYAIERFPPSKRRELLVVTARAGGAGGAERAEGRSWLRPRFRRKRRHG
jgi:3-methyladenine DNA glycosylase AlkD